MSCVCTCPRFTLHHTLGMVLAHLLPKLTGSDIHVCGRGGDVYVSLLC